MILHRISITKYYTDNEEPLIDPIKPYVGISQIIDRTFRVELVLVILKQKRSNSLVQ